MWCRCMLMPVSYTHLDVYKRQTRNEAIAPFVRQALIKAFSPGIANMAVTGLVALPGTMIGQILGGSSKKRRKSTVSYTHLDVYKRQQA